MNAVRTNKELKNALLRAMMGSENYTEAYKRISYVIVGDMGAVWGNARSILQDIGLTKADIAKIQSLVKKRL